MVFSSSIFLFIFLPLVVLLVFVGPRQGKYGVLWRNTCLSIGSFIFYAWGEPLYVFLLFFLAWINYVLAKKIECALKTSSMEDEKFFQNILSNPKKLLIIGILCNMGLLFVVKYGVWILNALFKISIYPHFGLTPSPIVLDALALPLGVSFFTFQAVSYLADVYRGDIGAAKRYIDFSCYLTMFSQLVAGPIVRYADIAEEINSRADSIDLFYLGIKRFVVGLAKKMLIANQLGLIADFVLSMPHSNLSTDYAWLGIIAFSLQIYFDFSAYSDMAIGIGLMFGFHYPENFRHPYAARSISEFWTRWHISLTSWIRDYIYFPLGGSRGGIFKTYFNIIFVFCLCGLWHGASLSFVLWGLWYGIFVALERIILAKYLVKLPICLQHIYFGIVLLTGYVIACTDDLSDAWIYLQAMVGITSAGTGNILLLMFQHGYFSILMMLSSLISFGKPHQIFSTYYAHIQNSSSTKKLIFEVVIIFYGCALCFLSTMFISSGSYNPFLYFRF